MRSRRRQQWPRRRRHPHPRSIPQRLIKSKRKHQPTQSIRRNTSASLVQNDRGGHIRPLQNPGRPGGAKRSTSQTPSMHLTFGSATSGCRRRNPMPCRGRQPFWPPRLPPANVKRTSSDSIGARLNWLGCTDWDRPRSPPCPRGNTV